MSPAFSPDGVRVAYTAAGPGFNCDAWTVPVLGGEAQQWLKSASGLAWTGPGQLLFSEIMMGVHVKVVAADQNASANATFTSRQLNRTWRTGPTSRPMGALRYAA